MKKHKLFLLALGIPIIVLLSMTIKPLQATYLGENIRLQTVPVDPRDLFYGDYVNLEFEIERVPLEVLEGDLASEFELKEKHDGNYVHYDGQEDGLDVYVALKEENGIHHVDYVTSKEPTSEPYVKGTLWTYSWEDTLRIDIPIERYYLEENTGKELEKDAREGRIIADLKVYKGYPVLKEIEVK